MPNSQRNYNYNPISTMDNLGAETSIGYPPSTNYERNNSGSDTPVEGEVIGSTHSSQQLMTNDTESLTAREIPNTIRANLNTSLSSISKTDWFTVIVLCFVNLINYMDRFTMAGVLTDIQKDLYIGDAEGGLIQTVFIVSYMLFAPIFGYLGDRYPRRWILCFGVFVWCATTFIGSLMTTFGTFIIFRAFVGIGEASYSTIAPTIISDLFVHDMRSKMLALFYFAIPVGSGLGYIAGSEMAALANNWRWALRLTPILGGIAVFLIFLIKEPERGLAEGSNNMETTNYKNDIKDLCKNRSFMLSTCGFTCVAFVTGALAWWGPKFIYLGLRMQPGNENLELHDVAMEFGIIAMFAGIIGVPLGSFLAQYFRRSQSNSCDPIICATGLLISSPLVYIGLVLPGTSHFFCLASVFLAQTSVNICWSVVADMIMYVVIPTRRSTASAFQILISHMFGDAGSPYLIGVISEAIKNGMRKAPHALTAVGAIGAQSLAHLIDVKNSMNSGEEQIIGPEALKMPMIEEDTNLVQFQGLQYSLFMTCFVEVLGAVFFLLTSIYIVRDKQKATEAINGSKNESNSDGSTLSTSSIDLTMHSRH